MASVWNNGCYHSPIDLGNYLRHAPIDGYELFQGQALCEVDDVADESFIDSRALLDTCYGNLTRFRNIVSNPTGVDAIILPPMINPLMGATASESSDGDIC